jgi:hypothetical protein
VTETLFQELGWEAPEAEPEALPGAFKPETLDGTPDLPPPGIYFGMPEELYHALPALSSHGIRKVASSPMVFWASTPWLSEKARKRQAERAAEEKVHQTIGRAYHCRIMEGAEEFSRRFAVELSPEECADALESTDQIKAAILAAEEKPFSKVPDKLPDGSDYMRSAKKDDWIAQLLDIDPDAKILAVMNEKHRAANAGKSFISREAYEQIEIAARMVEHDPEIRHAFKDGYAEVTLIWNCPRTGVPMKARVDYLKLRAIVDLKSIGNQRERSLENAIRFEIASYHYNVQPSVYFEGVREVRKLVKDETARIHFYDSDCPVDQMTAAVEWVEKWAAQTETEWLWVFQQKGDAPVTRGVFYPLSGTTKMVTDDIVLQQKRRFRTFSETFGVDPWLDVRPIYDLADEDLPQSACEI